MGQNVLKVDNKKTLSWGHFRKCQCPHTVSYCFLPKCFSTHAFCAQLTSAPLLRHWLVSLPPGSLSWFSKFRYSPFGGEDPCFIYLFVPYSQNRTRRMSVSQCLLIEWKGESVLEDLIANWCQFWWMGGRKCMLKKERNRGSSKPFLESERTREEEWGEVEVQTVSLHPAHFALDIGV